MQWSELAQGFFDVIANGLDALWSNMDNLAFLATVLAVILSLWQTRNESKLRIERESKSVARNVAAWVEEGACLNSKAPIDCFHIYVPAIIQNDNRTPLYDVVISVVGMYGAGPQREGEKNDEGYDCRCLVMQVPPGLWGLWIPTHGSGMGVMTALEISFRDARGKCWIRRGNGDLIAIDRNPLQYFLFRCLRNGVRLSAYLQKPTKSAARMVRASSISALSSKLADTFLVLRLAFQGCVLGFDQG